MKILSEYVWLKQDALDEINAAYGHLLEEDYAVPESKEFLKPEIPKNKKETKTKRESSRGIFVDKYSISSDY